MIPNSPSIFVPQATKPRGKRFHGSIQLEHKEDLKARGESSPDDGDALAMTFAVKVAAKQKPKYPNLVYSFGSENARWMM